MQYIEIGDRGGEGSPYENLGIAYLLQGDYRKSIEYHAKHLKIAIQISDRGGEGRAYGNLGIAYWLQGEYHKNLLKIAVEIGDGDGEGIFYRDIVT